MPDGITHVHKRRRPKATLVLGVIILALLGTCAFLYTRYQQVADQKPPSEAEKTAALTAKLGAKIELPAETPSVATVLNHTLLGNPQLAKEARNGDTLLVYAKAGRVVLYRPTIDKVIDMFHLEAAQASTEQAVQPQVSGSTTTKP